VAQPNRYHFTMRGESMTRLETFVAASFAFAITIMMISLGTMPDSIAEFVDATKEIPVFIASSVLLIWIWHAHAKWSRRYGLEDVTQNLTINLMFCHPRKLFH
jgi:uncharacterized membrane protein